MNTLLFRTSACQRCSHSKVLYDSHRYLSHYRSPPPASHRPCSSHIHLSISWHHVGKQGNSWGTYRAICSIDFCYKGPNLWSQEESLWSCGNWPVWGKKRGTWRRYANFSHFGAIESLLWNYIEIGPFK